MNPAVLTMSPAVLVELQMCGLGGLLMQNPSHRFIAPWSLSIHPKGALLTWGASLGGGKEVGIWLGHCIECIGHGGPSLCHWLLGAHVPSSLNHLAP